MRNTLAILSLLSLCFLTGCGGGSSAGGGGGGKDKTTDFTVTISPTTASVRTGETQQFTATVQNPVNSGVTWTVYGSGCSGPATCGTIANGLYTAPSIVPSPASITVLATSMFSVDYVSGPLALPSPEMMMLSGSLHSDGTGHFNGTQDIHDTGGQSVGEPIGGTYAFGLHGRAAGNLADGSAIALYMLGLDSEIALSVDPGDENPIVLIIKR